MIIRVFRARVHEGKQSEFERFFTGTAIPHVVRQPGLISLSVGRPLPSSPDEFVMIMKWKDLDSIKAFAGEEWGKAVILEEERHLLREVSLHHYEHVEDAKPEA